MDHGSLFIAKDMYSCTSWTVYSDDKQIDKWMNVGNVVTEVGGGEDRGSHVHKQ